jgi:hypothetical protein
VVVVPLCKALGELVVREVAVRHDPVDVSDRFERREVAVCGTHRERRVSVGDLGDRQWPFGMCER